MLRLPHVERTPRIAPARAGGDGRRRLQPPRVRSTCRRQLPPPAAAAPPSALRRRSPHEPAAGAVPRPTARRKRYGSSRLRSADADIPPMPVVPFAAARPMEIVRAVYVFAAKHPGGAEPHARASAAARPAGTSTTPTVSSRRATRRAGPTAWEPHGVGCAICLDVAHEAMQMYASGAEHRRHAGDDRAQVPRARSRR